MKKLLLAGALAGAIVGGIEYAKADVVLGGQNWTGGGDVLTLQAVVPGGNQPQNIQCVICGDNQPQQNPLFGYTNYQSSGNLTNAAFFSTNVSGGANPGVNTIGLGYDGSFLRSFVGGNLTFSIGVDVNDTSTAQTLQSFFLLNLTQHKVLASFTTPTSVPSVNNGTGFPDYTLTGFNINIGTDIQAGDKLIFFARLDPQNDGPDSFFLIPNQVAVPGPIAGAGIPGILAAFGLWGFAWRRRMREFFA